MLRLAALALLLVPTVRAQPDPAQPGPAVALRVMSFNVRLNTAADSLDAWPLRREGVAALVRFHDPDLVGLQEPQRNQLDDLAARLPGYAWLGEPRADGGPRDEYSALLYRTGRLDVLAHGTFWLSETPDVPGSRGWDAAYPRIATWARFRDRATGDTLLHLNTHLDHVGERARAESARLIRRRLAELAPAGPLVVTGDFNALPDSEPLRTLLSPDARPRLRDAHAISAEPPYGPASTWNGFRALVPGRRIDFVLVGEGVRVLEHAVLTDRLPSGRFPSDHLPVLAEIVVE